MSENTAIKPKKKHTVQYDRWGYFFIAPFFLIYLVFSLIPLVTTFVNTFYENYKIGLKDEGPFFTVPAYFNGESQYYTKNIGEVQDGLKVLEASVSSSATVDDQLVSSVKAALLDKADLLDKSQKPFSAAYDKMAKGYIGKSPKALTDATKNFLEAKESEWGLHSFYGDEYNRCVKNLDKIANEATVSEVDAAFVAKVKNSLTSISGVPIRFLKAYDKIAKSSQGKSAKDFLASVNDMVDKREWALVKNFRTVFASDILRYTWNTIIMWILGFIPQIVISLVLSVWFTNTELKLKFQQFFKTVIYMPNLIMASAFSMLFFTLFSDAGPINSIFIKLGWMDAENPLRYMKYTGWTRTLVAAMNFLMWYGNTTILLMAGIMGIDESLFEAARIDGASPTQVFFKVTMPLLMPIFIYVFITSMIGGIQMFDVPQILTNGAGTPNRTSMTVIMYLNSNLTSKNYGVSGAISVMLFVITGLLSSIVYKSNMKQYSGKGR